MFKRKNEGLMVLGSYILLKDGSHDIYLDPNSMSVYIDNNGEDEQLNLIYIGKYEYSKSNKTLSIIKALDDFPVFSPDTDNYNASRQMQNGRLVGNGPMWEWNPVVSQYLEGFPVSFDYDSFIVSTISLASYTWTGGRTCFDYGIFAQSGAHYPFTAKAIAGCYADAPIFFHPIYGALFTLTTMFMSETMKYITNQISFVYFYYPHRRYTIVDINTKNLFYINSKGKEIGISPLSSKKITNSSTPNWNKGMSIIEFLK